MKKLFIALIIGMLVFALSACGEIGKSTEFEEEATAYSEDINPETLPEEAVTEESLDISQEETSETTTLAQAENVVSKISTTVAAVIEKTTKAITTTTAKPTATKPATTTTKPATTTTKPATTTTKPTTTTTTAPSTTTTTAPSTTVESTTETTTVSRTGTPFAFRTKDLYGTEVTLSDFSYAKVIMINMWESWCGPCVNEMPDLQKLYTKYKDSGFLILGVTSSEISEAKSVVTQKRITYPILIRSSEFERFQTGYVPTTVFIDNAGNVLSPEPYVGGKSYSDWETVILSYLNA